MQFIKAKYLKNGKPIGRAYTFKTSNSLDPGDIAVNGNGKKLIVVDEPVSSAWVIVYGAENITVLSRSAEEESEEI